MNPGTTTLLTLSVADVAKLLGKSETRVRQLSNRGELQCWRVGSRRVRLYSREVVEEYLAKRSEAERSKRRQKAQKLRRKAAEIERRNSE